MHPSVGSSIPITITLPSALAFTTTSVFAVMYASITRGGDGVGDGGGKIGPGRSGPGSSGPGGGEAPRYDRVTMKLDGRRSSYANGTTAEPPPPTLWRTYARVYVKLRGWWIDPTDMYARAVPTGQCSFPGCPLPDRHPGIHLLDTDLLKSANMGNVRASQPPARRRPARACDSSARPWRRRYSRCIRCHVHCATASDDPAFHGTQQEAYSGQRWGSFETWRGAPQSAGSRSRDGV